MRTFDELTDAALHELACGTFETCRRTIMMSVYRGILLQKSFWGDKRNFLEPLMRFASGDVRDHIVSSKIDQGPPWWP